MASHLLPARLGRTGHAARAGVWVTMALATADAGCQQPEDQPVVGVEQPAGTGGAPAIGTGGASGSGGADSAAGTGGSPQPSDAGSAFDLAAAPDDTGGAPETPVVSWPSDAALEAPAAPDVSVTAPQYTGRPWHDTPQAIPGTIHAELYDTGGEGVAYHDTDPQNRGPTQADLPNNSPEATFRIDEGVDLASTRTGRDRYITGMAIQARQLYIGWTNPGEWVKYTVTVADAGPYVVSALIASQADQATISISLEDGTTTGPLAVPWTRSYYSWRFADNLATVNLTAGTHVMTVTWEAVALVNLEYLTFVRK